MSNSYSKAYADLIASLCVKGSNMADWDADLRDFLLGRGQ